jgi:preprotein translocase subunit SecG
MQAVVLTIHLLLALALILVVLMQRSEGGGLGIGGGGGIMTSRGAATALSKVTWGLGIAFVATSLTLTILAAHGTGAVSVIDRLEGDAPDLPASAPAPGLEGDLLPTVPTTPAAPAGDGPAAPPPVE